MFVDEVDILVEAGHGGAGAMSFRREKFVPRGGPDGGDGGHGGSVYIVASPNLNTLLNFRFQKNFEAGNGQGGAGSKRTGRSGADIELKVPVGTVVYERTPEENPDELVEQPEKPAKPARRRGHRGERIEQEEPRAPGEVVQ